MANWRKIFGFNSWSRSQSCFKATIRKHKHGIFGSRCSTSAETLDKSETVDQKFDTELQRSRRNERSFKAQSRPYKNRDRP
jgi:hypothetical protein